MVYEAEASANTYAGTTAVVGCSNCSNAQVVGNIGNSSANYLTINNVEANAAGPALVGIYYLENGTSTLYLSVNGGAATSYSLSGTSSTAPASQDILVTLNAGSNTIKFFNDSAAAPSIDRIVVTTGGSTWGLVANGERDKYSWPFSYTSLFNYPIGSGAVYQPAGITYNKGGGYPTFFYEDEDIAILTPSAPPTSLYYSSVGWTGGNRCLSTGRVLATVPIPDFYLMPNNGGNNTAGVLESDATTLEQNVPLTRCTVGGYGTTLAAYSSVSLYGDDPSGSHGGGLSALGGTIRLGEFLSGKIHHPMKVDLWAAQYYHCCSPVWPGTRVDGYSTSATYGGTNPNLDPGALLALPPSFNVASLSTTPGKIIAQAFMDYGAYVVDDVGANGWAICTEQGPNGRVVDEFQALYGYSMWKPLTGSPFMNDMITIFQNLNIVTNNSPNSIGGGGTPRVALAAQKIGN